MSDPVSRLQRRPCRRAPRAGHRRDDLRRARLAAAPGGLKPTPAAWPGRFHSDAASWSPLASMAASDRSHSDHSVTAR
jgi:hypothetical protein